MASTTLVTILREPLFHICRDSDEDPTPSGRTYKTDNLHFISFNFTNVHNGIDISGLIQWVIEHLVVGTWLRSNGIERRDEIFLYCSSTQISQLFKEPRTKEMREVFRPTWVLSILLSLYFQLCVFRLG